MAFHYGYPVLTSLMVSNFFGCLISILTAIWFGAFANSVKDPLRPLHANVTKNKDLYHIFLEEKQQMDQIYFMACSVCFCLFAASAVMLKLGIDDLIFLLHQGVIEKWPMLAKYRRRLEQEYQYTLMVSSCPWLVKDPEGMLPVQCHRTLMFTDPERKLPEYHERRGLRESCLTRVSGEKGAARKRRGSSYVDIQDLSSFSALSRESGSTDSSEVNFLKRRGKTRKAPTTKSKLSSS